jgi:hypothetical protein
MLSRNCKQASNSDSKSRLSYPCEQFVILRINGEKSAADLEPRSFGDLDCGGDETRTKTLARATCGLAEAPEEVSGDCAVRR